MSLKFIKIFYFLEKLFFGNVFDFGFLIQVQDMMKFVEQYGDIFLLQIGGCRFIVVLSFELVDEFCDELCFDKCVWVLLQNVCGFVGDGFFMVYIFELNWKKVYNILLFYFGQVVMKSYYLMMFDIVL